MIVSIEFDNQGRVLRVYNENFNWSASPDKDKGYREYGGTFTINGSGIRRENFSINAALETVNEVLSVARALSAKEAK